MGGISATHFIFSNFFSPSFLERKEAKELYAMGIVMFCHKTKGKSHKKNGSPVTELVHLRGIHSFLGGANGATAFSRRTFACILN